MRNGRLFLVGLAYLAAVSTLTTVKAQTGPDIPDQTRVVGANAADPTTLRSWDDTLKLMLGRRELSVSDVRDDSGVQGGRIETLIQLHEGVPVYGGSLTRQTERGITLSIVGTVHTNISVDSVPAIGAEQALSSMREASGGMPMSTEGPRLVILPTLDGRYALTYYDTMSDKRTYFVDAHTREVIRSVSAVKSQSPVGSGRGVLGDQKKVSTTQAAGTFRTHDQLRPAAIRTYTTRGSAATLERIVGGRLAFDSDYPVATTNEWSSQPAVVDAHVNAGWTQDYLYKQFNWLGISNSSAGITVIVDSASKDNAFAVRPPFGPGGGGAFMFGETPRGVPITSLDVVAHELMHNVSHASVASRTGDVLTDTLFVDGLGPATVNFQGSRFSCNSTTIANRPVYCRDGRWVLVSNHPGAIGEAFSDVVGTGTEFFFQPAGGSGALRADYKMAEDVAGFGPIRALDVPSTITTGSSGGALPFPDHLSRIFSYVVVITSGTRQNPRAFDLVPFLIVNGNLVEVGGTDDGGEHVNATVLGHAYYLAVEGGRNATSGLSVQGVGGSNRALIDRAFFRGMTVYMPPTPTMQVAALAVYQAAVDLHGSQSSAARAIDQAMRAVGLR